jgi:hypothetical protein
MAGGNRRKAREGVKVKRREGKRNERGTNRERHNRYGKGK